MYSLSQTEVQALHEFLDENLRIGFIRPSKVGHGVPILFVKKKDGSLRLCVDFHSLNRLTKKDRYPLPLISNLLDAPGKAHIYTKIDLRHTYHLVRIAKGDEAKTTFRTCYSSFEWLVIPEGLTNALEFHAEQVKYLGYILSPEGLSMDQAKVKTIQDWPEPRKVRNVQSFLGFANFYRRFIFNYSDIVVPLTRLTHKGIPFQFTDKAWEAFNLLKEAFTTAPILTHWIPDWPIIIETDASDYAVDEKMVSPGFRRN